MLLLSCTGVHNSLMNEEDDILTAGTLFWIKAGGRGIVSVPLEYLSEEQKQTLRSGLESDRYSYAIRCQNLNADYRWEEKHGLYEV